MTPPEIVKPVPLGELKNADAVFNEPALDERRDGSTTAASSAGAVPYRVGTGQNFGDVCLSLDRPNLSTFKFERKKHVARGKFHWKIYCDGVRSNQKSFREGGDYGC